MNNEHEHVTQLNEKYVVKQRTTLVISALDIHIWNLLKPAIILTQN